MKLINKFSKLAGYKTNVQKSVVFLYTTNKLSKVEINTHLQCIKKDIIPRNKFNQGSERTLYWKLQDTGERNGRRQKQMERYSMLMGWENQGC